VIVVVNVCDRFFWCRLTWLVLDKDTVVAVVSLLHA